MIDEKRNHLYSFGSVAVLACLFCLLAVGTAGATPLTDLQANDTNETIVVAPGDEGDFEQIQPALDAATDSDEIVVRPGTYREALEIDSNVTLVAPDGATLNGSTLDAPADAIKTTDGAAPTVEGFDIVEYRGNALYFWQTDGDWTVRNVSVQNTTDGVLIVGSGNGTIEEFEATDLNGTGITVFEADGNWRLEQIRIENAQSYGVVVRRTDGDVRIRTATITGTQELDAIRGDETGGDWLVENLTVADNHGHVDGYKVTGNWTVRNSTFGPTTEFPAIYPGLSSANWTIEHSTFVDRSADPTNAISAYDDNGTWTIRNVTTEGWKSAVRFSDGAADWRLESSTIRNTTGPGIEVDVESGNGTISGVTVANSNESGIKADRSNGALSIDRTDIVGSADHGLSADQFGDDVSINRSTVTDNNGTGVSATAIDGNWTVRESTILDNGPDAPPTGIDATDAAITVNATRNWWGQRSGPTAQQCGGNVDCGDPLATPPNPSLEDYADDDGIVRLAGLRAAVRHWRSGRIDTALLRDVMEAWSEGTPVE